MGKKEAFVFLKDPENAWIPAKLLTSSGDTADVQIPEYADEQSTICDGGKSAKKWIEAEVDLSDYAKGVLELYQNEKPFDPSLMDAPAKKSSDGDDKGLAEK